MSEDFSNLRRIASVLEIVGWIAVVISAITFPFSFTAAISGVVSGLLLVLLAGATKVLVAIEQHLRAPRRESVAVPTIRDSI